MNTKIWHSANKPKDLKARKFEFCQKLLNKFSGAQLNRLYNSKLLTLILQTNEDE